MWERPMDYQKDSPYNGYTHVCGQCHGSLLMKIFHFSIKFYGFSEENVLQLVQNLLPDKSLNG